MGYMRHHAILVTGWDKELVFDVHAKAVEIWSVPFAPHEKSAPQLVSEPAAAVTNGYWSFAIFPDGSKEGWSPSDFGDGLRAQFIEFLRTQTYEDGSLKLDWAEVQYGDDERETRVVNSSDDDELARTELEEPLGTLVTNGPESAPWLPAFDRYLEYQFESGLRRRAT